MIAICHDANGIWIIYGWYAYWPSQCRWMVPGTDPDAYDETERP
jgi:hypothetical protein